MAQRPPRSNSHKEATFCAPGSRHERPTIAICTPSRAKARPNAATKNHKEPFDVSPAHAVASGETSVSAPFLTGDSPFCQPSRQKQNYVANVLLFAAFAQASYMALRHSAQRRVLPQAVKLDAEP